MRSSPFSANVARRGADRVLLICLFPSKAQKTVDALQDNLDGSLLAVRTRLELFEKATEAFKTSGLSESLPERVAFQLAQSKHAYFTKALIDDLSRVEDFLEGMRRTFDCNNGRPADGFADHVIEAEDLLGATDANVNRLQKVTQELLDITGLE
ncbi:hypothetical protein [Mesorhizobium sp. KR9-304]|uniref:hypothetical protein n=1 Tax=Mesorhizobium sp. KR9-304 TaxID=3156614 RepID=UPI0032B3CED6